MSDIVIIVEGQGTSVTTQANAPSRVSITEPPESKVSAVGIIERVEDGDSIVLNETPSGLVNGSNATFVTAFSFVPESVQPFVNGLGQKRITHFNTSGTTTILFSDSPETGDIITVNYKKA